MLGPLVFFRGYGIAARKAETACYNTPKLFPGLIFELRGVRNGYFHGR